MSRAVLTTFEEYQKERVKFVQTIAELARQPQNIESLQAAGVMGLLRPLLLDSISSIQQSAALALARLASYSAEIAEAIVSNQVLPQLIDSLSRQNRFYKKAAAYVLKSVAKHSEHLAQCVIDAGALDALVNCLDEFDPNVKEGAAYALACIAKHNNPALAEEVAKAGAIERLSICIQDPETSLKKIATMALSEVAKHTPELADRIASNAGTLRVLTGNLADRDLELRQHSCTCLANIAKHNEDLAHKVAGADLFPKIVDRCLKEEGKERLQRQAALCLKEIAGQSLGLAKMVSDVGGVSCVVDYLNKAPGAAKLHAIMTLGFISGFDKELARSVVQCKGHMALVNALREVKEDHIKAAAAWSLGQIGRHSTELAKDLAEQDVMKELLVVYMAADEKSDLKNKAKRALRSIIQQCQEMDALQPLLETAPEKIVKHVVAQMAIILKNRPSLKKEFAERECLKRLQEIRAPPESKLQSSINEINDLFPPEVVQHYSPDYINTLIKKVEELHQHPE